MLFKVRKSFNVMVNVVKFHNNTKIFRPMIIAGDVCLQTGSLKIPQFAIMGSC